MLGRGTKSLKKMKNRATKPFFGSLLYRTTQILSLVAAFRGTTLLTQVRAQSIDHNSGETLDLTLRSAQFADTLNIKKMPTLNDLDARIQEAIDHDDVTALRLHLSQFPDVSLNAEAMWKDLVVKKKPNILAMIGNIPHVYNQITTVGIVKLALENNFSGIEYLAERGLTPQFNTLKHLLHLWSDANKPNNQFTNHKSIKYAFRKIIKQYSLAHAKQVISIASYAHSINAHEALKIIFSNNYNIYHTDRGIESNDVYQALRDNNFGFFSTLLAMGFNTHGALQQAISIEKFYALLAKKLGHVMAHQHTGSREFLQKFLISDDCALFREEMRVHPKGSMLLKKIEKEIGYLYLIDVQKGFKLGDAQKLFYIVMLLSLVYLLNIFYKLKSKKDKFLTMDAAKQKSLSRLESFTPTFVMKLFRLNQKISAVSHDVLTDAKQENHPKKKQKKKTPADIIVSNTTAAKKPNLQITTYRKISDVINQPRSKMPEDIQIAHAMKEQKLKSQQAQLSKSSIQSAISPEISAPQIESLQKTPKPRKAKQEEELINPEVTTALHSSCTLARPLPTNLSDVMQKLLDKGYQSYVVGGFVRDALLGGTNEDFDLVTDAPVAIVEEIFTAPASEQRSTLVRFKIEKQFFDISCNVNLTAQGIVDDAMRRCFSINALYADINTNVYDPTGIGLIDLKNKKIRSILPTNECFSDIVKIFRYLKLLRLDLNPSHDINFIKNKFAQFKIKVEKISAEINDITTIVDGKNTQLTFNSMHDQRRNLLEERATLLESFKYYFVKYFQEGDPAENYLLLKVSGFFDIFYNINPSNTVADAWIKQCLTNYAQDLKNNNVSFASAMISLFSIIASTMIDQADTDISQLIKQNYFPLDFCFNQELNQKCTRHTHRLLEKKLSHDRAQGYDPKFMSFSGVVETANKFKGKTSFVSDKRF